MYVYILYIFIYKIILYVDPFSSASKIGRTALILFFLQIAKIGRFEKSAILRLMTWRHFSSLNECRDLRSHGLGDIFVDAGQETSHLRPVAR